MSPSLCPLCGSQECSADVARSEPTVRYACPQHCGTFRMGNVFLKYVWPLVTAEERGAIAAYMRATKGPQRAAPLIEGDNYREYILQGSAFQRRAAVSAPSMAE